MSIPAQTRVSRWDDRHHSAWVRNDQAEAHVRVAIARCQTMVGVECLPEAFAFRLEAEGHQECIAAEGSRARAALEIVGHHNARSALLRDVDVVVDAARQHEVARSIDRVARLSQALAEPHNPTVSNADVARKCATCRRDGSAFYNQIKACHRSVLSVAQAPAKWQFCSFIWRRPVRFAGFGILRRQRLDRRSRRDMHEPC